MSKIRMILLSLVCLSAVILGAGLGTGDWDPVAGKAAGVSFALLSFPLGWSLGRSKPHSRLGFSLILPSLLLLSWLGSYLDLRRAEDECGRDLDRLRAALSQYRDLKGDFPQDLGQLGWPKLPGNRLIGASVLHYDYGPRSFRLYVAPRKRDGLWTSCSAPRKK